MQERDQNKSFSFYNFSSKNRGGLSTVIVTLILILVSIVAVGIVWVVVRNIIQTGTEGVGLSQFSISAKIMNVAVDNSSNNVSLTVKRNAGEGELEGISFIFSSLENNEVITRNVSLKELEQMKFIFHLNTSVSDLISVSIVPLIKQDGKQISGIALDKYNLGNGKNTFPSQTACSPSNCSILGYVCGTWNNGTCAGTFSCGTCTGGQTCNSNGVCVASCVPATCAGLGYECGTGYANGTCAGTLSCGFFSNGSCQIGYSCNASRKCVASSGSICEASGGRKCWYVDNSATGVNNGSDWTNAWVTFSSMNWGLIKPGDFVYISGGVISKTYTESWTVGANGNSTNRITIKIDSSSPNHKGIVIFDYDSYGDSSSYNGINIANRNYLTFSGDVNGENHFQLKNLRNIYDRAAAYGIFGWGVSNVLIDHLDFVNVNTPIRIWGGTNYTVSNSNFLQTRGDAAIAFLVTTGSWDANKVYNNYIELLSNTAQPPGATYPYVGPDGIQCGNGTSIYNNTIKVNKTTVYTSSQHPDDVQSTGAYLKIYGNEFINVGDSVIDLAGSYIDPVYHDVLIYNNIFRIIETIDPYPNYIRVYGSSGYGIQSITNYKIFNNLFVDNNYWPITIQSYQGSGNPPAFGNEIKNNIFYNIGTGDQWHAAISIENSSNFNSSSFSFDGNIYYHPSNTPHIVFRGIDSTATAWISANEPHGKLVAPTFVNYVPFSASNNFHLSSSDTAAKDAGLSLGSYFTTDKDGISRPQGSAWDIGAYEYS